MNKINNILNFYFSPSDFHIRGKNIFSAALKNQFDLKIGDLQKIKDKIGEMSFQFDHEKLIPGVFRKFKKFLISDNINFDRRDLGTLTYTLTYTENNIQTIFSNENEIRIALQVIESNWRDSFLSGLIDCLLNNWESEHKMSLELLSKFITEKLENYKGSRTTLNSFKNNKRYFSIKNGNLILGDTLAKLNRPIQEATKVLGVPKSWFSYSYFSRVILTYYEKNKANITDQIDNLIEVLQIHNSSITNKRLVSKMIIQANQAAFANLQDKIKKFAFIQIGDPTIIAFWLPFENANESEKKEISEARNILDEWIAKQFIDIFFRLCINDVRRKRFWLKVASKNMVSFKVYGPIRTKNILKRDERIVDYLEERFNIVASSRDISAFVLYIGDYMLIEFSDAGYAFYAYKINGRSKPNMNNRLYSVDQLRNGAMPMLVYRSGYSINYTNTEGRLTHNDGELNWEQVFEYWFKNVAGINV